MKVTRIPMTQAQRDAIADGLQRGRAEVSVLGRLFLRVADWLNAERKIA